MKKRVLIFIFFIFKAIQLYVIRESIPFLSSNLSRRESTKNNNVSSKYYQDDVDIKDLNKDLKASDYKINNSLNKRILHLLKKAPSSAQEEVKEGVKRTLEKEIEKVVKSSDSLKKQLEKILQSKKTPVAPKKDPNTINKKEPTNKKEDMKEELIKKEEPVKKEPIKKRRTGQERTN